MNIGFDLDGVLVDWHSAVFTELRCFGKLYDKISDIYLSNNSKFFDFFVELPFLYTRPVPKKKDLEVLYKISARNTIFYITSRPSSVMNVTFNYLTKYGFPHAGNLIFSGSKKSSVINSLGISIFLDDRLEIIDDILNNSPDCLPVLFSREWNNSSTYEHRVSSIEEFYNTYVASLTH